LGSIFLPIGCPQGDKKTALNQNRFSLNSSGRHPNQKSKEPTLVPIKDNIPACAGPNIHGGAEAMRAGRLDVLDLFASFWIKPKRRRTAAPENSSVKEAPVLQTTQKSKEPTLVPKNRPRPNVRWPEHPRSSRGPAGWPIGCS
jgi:hypothetical protein